MRSHDSIEFDRSPNPQPKPNQLSELLHVEIFKYADTTFVIPVHNNRVKAIYVRKVLELIELSDREQEEEE